MACRARTSLGSRCRARAARPRACRRVASTLGRPWAEPRTAPAGAAGRALEALMEGPVFREPLGPSAGQLCHTHTFAQWSVSAELRWRWGGWGS